MPRYVNTVREKPKEKIFPSRFGSHRSMVVRSLLGRVVCLDEKGEYSTLEDRLDNGLADPNRYNGR